MKRSSIVQGPGLARRMTAGGAYAVPMGETAVQFGMGETFGQVGSVAVAAGHCPTAPYILIQHIDAVYRHVHGHACTEKHGKQNCRIRGNFSFRIPAFKKK